MEADAEFGNVEQLVDVEQGVRGEDYEQVLAHLHHLTHLCRVERVLLRICAGLCGRQVQRVDVRQEVGRGQGRAGHKETGSCGLVGRALSGTQNGNVI